MNVLVDFKPDARIKLMDYACFQRACFKILRRQVDLVTREGLKPLINQNVLDHSEVI